MAEIGRRRRSSSTRARMALRRARRGVLALLPCLVAAGLAVWMLDAELRPPHAEDNPWAPPSVIPAAAPAPPSAPKSDDYEPWETVPT